MANATVYGFFNEPNTDTRTGVTGTDGVAFIEGDRTRSSVADFCFEVTDVTHGTCTYDPAANAVPQTCESGWVFSDGNDVANELVPVIVQSPGMPPIRHPVFICIACTEKGLSKRRRCCC